MAIPIEPLIASGSARLIQTRQAHGPHHFRKTFLTFCCALLLESVIMQLVTTAGGSTNVGSDVVIASTSQVDSGNVAPLATALATPTPTPTTIMPKIGQSVVLAAAPAQPLSQPLLIFHPPLKSYYITQFYSAYHTAVDLAATSGTPIFTTTEGVVAGTGYLLPGGGLMVQVTHPNGYTSYYAHLSAITSTVGQKVDNTIAIGHVGSTGWSTGPHLHFMIQHLNQAVNPMTLINL